MTLEDFKNWTPEGRYTWRMRRVVPGSSYRWHLEKYARVNDYTTLCGKSFERQGSSFSLTTPYGACAVCLKLQTGISVSGWGEVSEAIRRKREFIVCLRRLGHTHSSIAARVGLSAARVQQIVRQQAKREDWALSVAGDCLDQVGAVLTQERSRRIFEARRAAL